MLTLLSNRIRSILNPNEVHHASTIEQVTSKLLAMLSLGSCGPVILVSCPSCSFDAASLMSQQVERAGIHFSASLATPGNHNGWIPSDATDQVVFLHGLEFLPEESIVAHLKTLNRRRDGFVHEATAVIIWLTEAELQSFMLHCADLFSHRSLMARVQCCK